MKLLKSTVAETVIGWNLMFPGKKDSDELEFLAVKFYKALGPIFSENAFRMAAEIVESEQEFFPTIAHMKKVQNQVVDKIIRDRDLYQKALPESTDDSLTDKEVENNQKRIKIIADQLSGKISMSDAIKMQDKLVSYVT